jgi:hypothetical protein
MAPSLSAKRPATQSSESSGVRSGFHHSETATDSPARAHSSRNALTAISVSGTSPTPFAVFESGIHTTALSSGRNKTAGRRLLAGAVPAILIGVAASLYSRNSHAPEYGTSRIDRGDIDATYTTTGNLNTVITVQVGSQVSGNIIALYADVNTKVNKGQMVAEIDPAPFKAVVDQAAATLNAAKAA